MRHFPLFFDTRGKTIAVAGGGAVAEAKLRLLMKTEARLAVFAENPGAAARQWAADGRLRLHERAPTAADFAAATLIYIAQDDPETIAAPLALARQAGVPVNVVDDLEAGDFITPAIVDRDPVTVAIGTEGTAPVLARRLKKRLEETLSVGLGRLARAGGAFRHRLERLDGAARRRFWARYYDDAGPAELAKGEDATLEARLTARLETLLDDGAGAPDEPGRVHLVGAGPGDPELLTLKARRLLDEADVVIHDRLVSPAILELARREARLIEVGKIPGGPSWKQADIDALMVAESRTGATVVRLKSGDPGIYGRLDEEMDALDAAGIAFDVTAGITAAAAGAARLGVSLTKRGRNKALRFLTGHDVDGFAEHDWAALAKPGATAAIYMGVRAARFLQGRLMMHGAGPDTHVTAVENISRPDEKTVAATLGTLPDALTAHGIKGPAVLFLGLAPRHAARGEAAPAPLAEGLA